MSAFVPPKTALVVGAGILGASIAYRLVRAGVEVTILDKSGPAAGASGASWAWINAVSAGTQAYFNLRRAGIAAHHDLEQELAGRWPVDWMGTLGWGDDLFDDGEHTAQHQAWGHPGKAVSREEAQQLEPLLVECPDRLYHSPDDGLLDSTAATDILIAAAVEAGAKLITRVEAKGLYRDGDQITGVDTDHGRLDADVTITVSGTGTPHLLESAGLRLPMANTPGLLLTTRPVQARLSKAIWTPEFFVKQFRDGRLSIVDSTPRSLEPGREQAMVTGTQALFPAVGALSIERADRPTRPIPLDGLPVIGCPAAIQGLYVAVMHSGVTLSPLVGRLAAEEILTDAKSGLLPTFRLERFGESD